MVSVLERPVRTVAQDEASFRLIRLDGLSVPRPRAGGAWAGPDTSPHTMRDLATDLRDCLAPKI